MEIKDGNKIICPVCGQSALEEYDICAVCSWEYDLYQYQNPEAGGGANRLCLNDYKKRWAKLEEVMPRLIEKYGAVRAEAALGKYDELTVPRNNVAAFINELSGYGIKVMASFYNACSRYGYKRYSFHGYVWSYKNTPKEANDEILSVIFAKDPVLCCNEYDLIQIAEILAKSGNAAKTWETLTPNICVEPNPSEI